MNTYLKYQPPVMQFLAFLALASGCYLLTSFITTVFFSDIIAAITNNNAVTDDLIPRYKVVQLVSAIGSFLLPALLFGYFSSPEALPYVGVQKSISPVLLLACLFLLVSVQPFVGWLGNLNAKINFGSMQASLQSAEDQRDRVMKVFLNMKSVSALLVNIVVMALLPAVAEELFFRGALQKALLRLSDQPWLAILISSLIFALLHLTVFKVLPIFFLGLLLGTIYHFTRNLWYTIFIHFLNNAMAVMAYYLADRNQAIKRFANDNINVHVLLALISLAAVVALMYFIKKKGDEVLPAIVTNEDNDYIA
jgi:hypothetical protein